MNKVDLALERLALTEPDLAGRLAVALASDAPELSEEANADFLRALACAARCELNKLRSTEDRSSVTPSSG